MGVEWSGGPGWQRSKRRQARVAAARQSPAAAELHLLRLVLVGAVIGAAAMTVVLVVLGMRG